MAENAPTDRFKKLTVIISIVGALVMLLGAWATISVTYSKVDDTAEEQIEIKKELKEMHLEFDEYKIETMEKHYQLGLKIERLEADVEYLKSN